MNTVSETASIINSKSKSIPESTSKSGVHSLPLLATILCIGILSGSEVDLFTPSFPELKQVFNLTPFLVFLTVSANFVAYCLCSLFAGTLGDRFNRRNVILISLFIFIVGSLCCVLANHYSLLILGRLLQGAGMAAPSVLAYVIIADHYPIEKQSGILGVLNGLVTFAMAFAPIVGSFVNLYCSWHGNFIILLSLGLICFIATHFFIPNRAGQPNVSLSPVAYFPLFKSKKLMYSVLGLCFLFVPYWVFVVMSPLLYMESMQINIKHFGYYQGAIAGIFSIISLMSPRILKKIGQDKALLWGNILSFASVALMLLVGIFNIMNPLIITGLMMVFAVAVVFPVNIIYPQTLEILPGAKSRTAALINSLRLLLTAGFLQLNSYFYDGQFFSISLTNFIVVSIYLGFMMTLHSQEQKSELRKFALD